MSLAKARAKIRSITERVIPYGKKDKLFFIDKDTYEVLDQATIWSWTKLNPLETGDPTFAFTFVAPGSLTEMDLKFCRLAYDGVVHDVVNRDAPISFGAVEWRFKTKPTNERID